MSIRSHAPALTFINADMGRGAGATLRIQGARVSAAPRQRGDTVLDLKGDRLLPGLINAHDHLQFNHLPRLSYPAHYRNASEWIADVKARVDADAALAASTRIPRARRYLAGGLKNLLSGVTTVAHHDPLEDPLLQESFPCRVLTHYAWAHSLHVDGEEQVRESCAATAAQVPWIMHAAEGTDAAAGAELDRLQALGCLRANTVLVHGVAMNARQRALLVAAGAGLIWCPTSNLRLFGQTAQVGELIALGRVALGTDSRLTGAADLLDELRSARECLDLEETIIEDLVTRAAARLLRLDNGAGTLEAGAPADLLVLPAGLPLSRATRADVRLVMLDGSARYGDHEYTRSAAPAGAWTEVRVDGRAKRLQSHLATLLRSGQVTEPGVDVPAEAGRAACG